MPELIYLVQTFGESTQVAVRSNDEALSVAHVPGTKPRGHGITLGRALPLYCTAVGKIILAGMDDAKLHKIAKVLSYEPKTINTLGSRRAFLDHIMRVKEQGYAMNNQESEIDIRAIAVPLYNRPGSVLAALSVSADPDEMTSEMIARLLPELRACAERISKAIYERPRRLQVAAQVGHRTASWMRSPNQP